MVLHKIHKLILKQTRKKGIKIYRHSCIENFEQFFFVFMQQNVHKFKTTSVMWKKEKKKKSDHSFTENVLTTFHCCVLVSLQLFV